MAESHSDGEYVPREFFCPISKQFMKDPVIDPSTQQTCDRLSLISNNNLNDHENLKADYDLREKINEWRGQHTLAPTFAFISTPSHLAAAVKSLLNPKQINQMESLELLELLQQLESAIKYRSSVILSSDSTFTLCRLIAECPFPTNFEFRAQWVKLSVSILSDAHDIHHIDFHEIQTKMLTLIDNVCHQFTEVTTFQSGLVNLIYSIWTDNNKKQILGCHGIINSLTSTILSLNSDTPEDFRKKLMDKLFFIITDLYSSDPAGTEHCKIAQALVSLVWPMNGKLEANQYLDLLETLASNLGDQEENSTALRIMTRAGLVTHIFSVLEYLEAEDGEIETALTNENAKKQILSLSSEILLWLSLSRIGRLEILRVIQAHDSMYLNFFTLILSGNDEGAIMSVLTILFNLLERSRYSLLGEIISIVPELVSHSNPDVRELATDVLNLYGSIILGQNNCIPPEF